MRFQRKSLNKPSYIQKGKVNKFDLANTIIIKYNSL